MSAQTDTGSPGDRARVRGSRWGILAAAAVVALGLDQVTKYVVRGEITPGERIGLLPGVDLVHTTNRGVAFGAFAGNPRLVAVLTALVLVAVAVWLTRLGNGAPAVMAGGGLLVGGALGNLIDRLTRSGVTDFVAAWRWPPFNVADVAIVLAAVILVLSLVRDAPT